MTLTWRILRDTVGAAADHGAFGTARHGARHMGQGGSTRATRQDELLQSRQPGVVMRQRCIQRLYRVVLQQPIARNGQLTTQVEQFVLHGDQQRAYVLRQVLTQKYPQLRVEFVDFGFEPQGLAFLNAQRRELEFFALRRGQIGVAAGPAEGVAQLDHGLHVDEALTHLAIGEAQDVQGRVERD